MVGTDNRVVINRVVASVRSMYMYAFNHAMLRMNRGYVQEASTCMSKRLFGLQVVWL